MEITSLISRLQAGDSHALNEAVALVYGELRLIASRLLSRERSDHILQPTALVHEVFTKLHGNLLPVRSRQHFLAICARAMRQILVDEARKKKHSPHNLITVLNSQIAGQDIGTFDLAVIDAVLGRLEAFDERKCRLAELIYFTGASQREAAETLGLSERTVRRELSFTRAWLLAELMDEK